MKIHNQDDSFFILDTQELMAAKRKRGVENKLAFAVMLKFFQLAGRFLTKDDLMPDSVVISFASQLDCDQ